ncbi:nucleotidyltransferase family protein [Pedobacter paludis]|uniref:Nucleotidyltransferase family protein n=1 Tax=Pedobacter paludis TaxID=2203212 RepID=A0A317ETF6_9SPHI|nr:nucleotidyltransferase family protein [Pedobacter paludis]PWS29964.1 nucleotidyltransferase family protein [Pedobacter paludis]
MDTGVIILAAGNSSRLGRPKQLLELNGKTLISHVIEEAENAKIQVIAVVTGSNSDLIQQEIKDKKILIVDNQSWEIGMASGINAGLSALLNFNNKIESIIISVCDQPFISRAIFDSLIDAKNNTNKGIVASHYQNIIGTPVLFDKKYFGDLKALTGEEGAKKILKVYPNDLVSVPFENGEIDIDTQSDYLNLQNHK